MPDQVRVAVAGCGSFGKNHLRVYRELEKSGAPVALVAAVEPNAELAAQHAAAYGIPVFPTPEALLSAGLGVQASSVAVPTIHHHAVASALLDGGLDVLVEKPIAATLAEADDLIARAERGARILQVGHLERFNPAVIAVQKQPRRPMFFEAHRLSIFTPRALDVDVVLDLMIHDLDVVLTLAASPVREVRAVGLPILSPKVDIANVRVEFESGCVANFTASRVSTERVRKLRFFEPRQYVSIDYARRDLLIIRMDETPAGAPQATLAPELIAVAQSFLANGSFDKAALQKLFFAGKVPADLVGKVLAAKDDPAELRKLAEGLAAPAAPAGPAPGLSFLKPEVEPGEPLKLEIESFLESVSSRRAPRVTARQGRAALELALEIEAKMEAHATRAGLAGLFHPEK